MKKDLTDTADIQLLVDTFYDQVKKDEVIGYIFTDIAKVDWGHHLPIMYSFWEMMLFGTGGYKGDPMTKHIQLNEKTKLEQPHFDRWKKIFTDSVDQLFEGDKANEAKQRAGHIASLMAHRVQQSN
jgi:hemoglobin